MNYIYYFADAFWYLLFSFICIAGFAGLPKFKISARIIGGYIFWAAMATIWLLSSFAGVVKGVLKLLE